MTDRSDTTAVVIDSGHADSGVQDFLFAAGHHEKRWPIDELKSLLGRESSFVAAVQAGKVIAGAQILWHQPFPVEQVFPGCIEPDGRRPCEVSLIAVDPAQRRSANDGGAALLDSLVSTIYRLCRQRAVSHIYTLFEEWTIEIFQHYLCIETRKVSAGTHYWCGTERHGPHCRLTFACCLSLDEAAERWQTERPEFWHAVSRSSS